MVEGKTPYGLGPDTGRPRHCRASHPRLVVAAWIWGGALVGVFQHQLPLDVVSSAWDLAMLVQQQICGRTSAQKHTRYVHFSIVERIQHLGCVSGDRHRLYRVYFHIRIRPQVDPPPPV